MRLFLAGLAALVSLPGDFRWTASPPLIGPQDRGGEHFYSIKDPSIVRFQDRWHLFCTVRGVKRSHQIEYLSFADWGSAGRASRTVLRLKDGYFCAPQVFYFAPQRKWVLLYQVGDPSRHPELQPAFSTTDNLADPLSWSAPRLLFGSDPEGVKAWIDFWIVCDDSRAYLFFTSNDGRMWRSDARLADFPHGWDRPRIVLEDDIFEASHTYRLKGQNRFLTIVEAQGEGGRRYYKAYTADHLDGSWSAQGVFAFPGNVRFSGDRWTGSFSHGELLRDGYDQTLTVDPDHLQFLFQGVADADRLGKRYGEIPWRLGLLSPQN
jgi:hypothetical protein